MSTTPALDLRKVKQQFETVSGVRSGFPTPDDQQRFHHAVELDGLARDNLGHDRFCTGYHVAMRTAVRLAPVAFLVRAVRDHRHVVVGYEFSFETADLAAQFNTRVMAALAAAGVV